MKRAWCMAVVVALALAVPALGQIRGVPASVTSPAPNRPFPPGPPASVTSLGPNGFSSSCSGVSPLIPSAMGCTPTQFTSGFFFPDAGDRGPVHLGSRRHHRNSSWPVYVPYAYPVAVGAEPEPEEAEEPEPPAPTIFEHRSTSEWAAPRNSSRYGTHYLDSRERAPEPAVVAPQPSPSEVHEQIPFVLVYRDGHQREITNYAIVGQTLYDLGAFMAHKIPLAELNLRATIKANDDRGVEFTVPSSVKVD